MTSEELEHRKKYPETREEIQVEDYHMLVLKVFNIVKKKFGPWVGNHKQDLIQTGYVGLLKAKEKYQPGRGSFLGLAYLRIMSAMQNDIAKYAKYEVHTTPAEELKMLSHSDSRDDLKWDSFFSCVILDYDAIIRLIRDEDDRKLLVGLVNQYPYWKLRAVLKESKEDHEIRVQRLKEELLEILGALHPSL